MPFSVKNQMGCTISRYLGCIICDNTCTSYEMALGRVSDLKEQADNKNGDACYEIAQIYLKGLHVYSHQWVIEPNNQSNALFYAKRGADQYHPGCIALVQEIEREQKREKERVALEVKQRQQAEQNRNTRLYLNASVIAPL